MTWRLDESPEPFEVSTPGAEYAVFLMMGADGNLSEALIPDIEEMMSGVSEEVAVLLWIDTPDEGVVVGEVLPGRYRILESHVEACTGDPRPLADFFGARLGELFGEDSNRDRVLGTREGRVWRL